MEDLPPELDRPGRIPPRVRALASHIPADMRLSVVVRTSFYHIRFTLHRPYATAPAPPPPLLQQQALDAAASAAYRLVAQVTLASSSPDGGATAGWVDSHTHWGPFHCFSLLLRGHVLRAAARGGISEVRLGPLPRERAPRARAPRAPPACPVRTRQATCSPRPARFIALVKNLAFPYHDSSTGTHSQHASPRSSVGNAGSSGALRSAFPGEPYSHMQQQEQQLAPPPQVSELVSPSSTLGGSSVDYFGGPSGGAGRVGALRTEASGFMSA
ncbi:hypothetical protein DFH11DRAFT_1733516 [Phellopilus nigrolimitatus]|nr:hypothetical protein DFH11DRAFT_1733516 [Phellopilus nigrolimitatus]